jgi:hypothetical protein
VRPFILGAVSHWETGGRFAFMKDPAILFYTSDFLSGTMTMTNEQVGAYMRLLCLQHQKGELSEKDMLFICGTRDEDIWNKFEKSESGTYFNSRLRFEIERRKAYSESRRNNRKKKDISKTYVEHMENENENVNRTKKKGGAGGKQFVPPTLEEVIAYFKLRGYTQESAERAFYYYHENAWKDKNNTQVQNWKSKMNSTWFKPENKKQSSQANYQTLTP